MAIETDITTEQLETVETVESASRQPGRFQSFSDKFLKPVKGRDLLSITGQLALMLETGTTLVESLHALTDQAEAERLGEILTEVELQVSGGMTLAYGLAEHPAVFDNFYVSTVASGESSGMLPGAFRRIESYLKKREDLKASIQAAMMYPAVLTTLATGAVFFLVAFVLPRFTEIFESNGVLLPLPTRMLLAVSDFLQSFWYLVLIGMMSAFTGLYLYVTSKRGKPVFDRLMINLPIVGKLSAMIQSSILLRTLGTLLEAGLPILESLEVAGAACRNVHFQMLASKISLGVKQGDGLAVNFSKSDLFPSSIKQMIATGERTGNLGLVMTKVADDLDDRADHQTKKLSSLIEPLIIIVMGLVIGFIAVAMMLPLFKLSTAVKG